MKPAILFGLLIASSCALFPQTKPDVREILGRVSETYRAAKEYVLEADVSVRANSGHARLAFKPPNRYRIEGNELFGNQSPFAEAVILSDGSAVWFYLPESNQYISLPISDLTEDALGDLGDLRPEAVDHFLMWRYREAESHANGAKLVREEIIKIGPSNVDCYVLQLPLGREAYTWWIGKKTSRVLKEDHGDVSSIFTTIKLNDPVPDDFFKFTPPPGARRIERQP